MTDIAARDHVHAARVLRRHLATYEENRDLVLMGAYRAGADPAIDAAIACHPAVIEYIRQDSDEGVPLDASVAELKNGRAPGRGRGCRSVLFLVGGDHIQ